MYHAPSTNSNNIALQLEMLFEGASFYVFCVLGVLLLICTFSDFALISFCLYNSMTGVVYPVVARWVWHKDGWLRTGDVIFPGYPYQDFAGSSTVHLCGGVVALWGAVFCGPRLGRFDRDGNHDLQGHSIPVGKLKKSHHVKVFMGLCYNHDTHGSSRVNSEFKQKINSDYIL